MDIIKKFQVKQKCFLLTFLEIVEGSLSVQQRETSTHRINVSSTKTFCRHLTSIVNDKQWGIFISMNATLVIFWYSGNFIPPNTPSSLSQGWSLSRVRKKKLRYRFYDRLPEGPVRTKNNLFINVFFYFLNWVCIKYEEESAHQNADRYQRYCNSGCF